MIAANDYYNTPGVRETCHAVKQTCDPDAREQAIRTIADYFIALNVIRPGDNLIPAPQHTGNAEYTKEIAERVAKHTGANVCDVLHCIPHKPLYEQKYVGKHEISMYVEGSIPTLQTSWFVDNVLSTGITYNTANKLFGGILKPLVYAVDYARLGEEAAKKVFTVDTKYFEIIS